MSDNGKKGELLDIAKDVAKDVYVDAVKSTAKNVGGFFGTLSGFFNNVVVYPLKKLNIEYEQKAIAFERQMQEKYNNIPEENKIEPQLSIVGPAMESLKYNIMDEDLSEMFSNLLVSDLDSRTQNLCTPAFIRIMEQLSPMDAKVYKEIMCSFRGYDIGVASIMFQKKGTDKQYIVDIPKIFLTAKIEFINNYDLALALENLQRLGLIEISFLEWLKDETIYETIKEKVEVKKYEKLLQNEGINDYEVKIYQKGALKTSSFSNNFAKVCLRSGK